MSFIPLDADFRIVSMSASVQRHLGYLPEELIGKPFTELGLLTEESLARAVTDTMRIFNGETVESAEYELVAKDGTVKIAEMRNASICKNGKVVLIVTVARDITDKKKAERALESSEARFRRMAENITNGLIIVEEGETVYVNDQACRICGYPREELFSLWGPDLTASEEKHHKDQILGTHAKEPVFIPKRLIPGYPVKMARDAASTCAFRSAIALKEGIPVMCSSLT